jgi:hypothetical protein
MGEERSPKWRGWVALGLLVAGASTVILTWPDPVAEERVVDLPSAPTAPLPPPPLRNLDRAALIDAAALAASAFTSGDMTDAKLQQFAGRRFELALPFGCSGPAALDEKLVRGWSYDSKSGNLQVVFPSNIVVPLEGEVPADIEPEPVTEFAKSFWIEREWLRQAICPSVSDTEVAAGTADAPSLAIAEISNDESPRADDRNGAPYQVSKRLAAEQMPDEQGLKMVITGRLSAAPAMPFQCKSLHPDRRPICVILGKFDRVQITNASGSEVYGEWRD